MALGLEDFDADEFQPQPDDHEVITRGEHRRMIHLFVQRFRRIEALCFEDAFDDAGKIERPSLQTAMSAVYTHVNVMCAWTHALIRVSKLLTAGTIILGVILAAIHFIRVGV